MRKRLQEEWKRIEEKKKELEEARKQEEERRRKEEEERIEEERRRLEWEAKERERREEEARLEEQREKDRIERIRRQMEEEKMRLESVRKRLMEEDEDADVEFFVNTGGSTSKEPDQPAVVSDTKPEESAGIIPATEKVHSTMSSSCSSSFSSSRDADLYLYVKTEARKTVRRTMRQTRRVMVVKAKYDYDANKPEELSFRKGDVLLIDYVVGNATGWVRGQTDSGEGGLIPESFVEKFSEDDGAEEEEKELKAKEEEWKREQEAEKTRELEREKDRERKRREVEAAAEAEQEGKDDEVLVRALYDYRAQEEGELSFKKGDIIKLLEKDDEGGWWIGDLRGIMGLFPKNFVEMVNAAEVRAKVRPARKEGSVCACSLMRRSTLPGGREEEALWRREVVPGRRGQEHHQ